MKLIFFIFGIFFSCHQANAQGGWFLKYQPLDSLDNTLIGQDIRIDFKSSPADTVTGEASSLNERRLLSKRDTVNLFLKDQLIRFKEQWILYPDLGSLRDQSLVSINYPKDIIEIRKMIVLGINSSTIEVEAFITFKKRPQKNYMERMMISRSLIKGLVLARH